MSMDNKKARAIILSRARVPQFLTFVRFKGRWRVHSVLDDVLGMIAVGQFSKSQEDDGRPTYRTWVTTKFRTLEYDELISI